MIIYVYYIGAALLIWFSIKSLRGGIAYFNYIKTELTKPRSGFTPFASIIAPCKGMDEGLRANLAAVLAQDYPEYDVIFVVDDADDPAVPVIEEVSRKAAKNAKVVIAAKSVDSGQKVENLREAVLHADARSEVFVFVDSDVRPGRDWLQSLVGPLADENLGATTGYRWFVSETTSFAVELRSAWNASIASVQGPDMDSNFCWGGSMAVRRETFERLNIRENWRGTLSDDLAVTRMMNAAKLPIKFVPAAIVPSTGTCSAAGLYEFTNRQIKIVRVYAQKLWLISFLGSGLFIAVMAASAVLAVCPPVGSFEWAAALFTLISVTGLSSAKAWLRCRAVMLALPERSVELRRQLPFQVTLWALTPAIFFVNCAAALVSRRITWRGTEYEMVSPTETRVL